jgi:hypothetical protein
MLHGYIHLADIHVLPEIDPENAYRFVKRGSINIQMIKNAVDTLLSKTTSWWTLSVFITDLFKDSTVMGDKDDIDQALLSICGISEDAATRFMNLLDHKRENNIYERNLANHDDDLDDWKTAATMREGFLQDTEKTIDSLEQQLNDAHARIFDLHRENSYRAPPAQVKNLLATAEARATTAEALVKDLRWKNASLEAQLLAKPSRPPTASSPPKSQKKDQQQVYWQFGVEEAAKLAEATLATFPHMSLPEVLKSAMRTSQAASPPPKTNRATRSSTNANPFNVSGFPHINQHTFVDIARAAKAKADATDHRANPSWNMRGTSKSLVKGLTSKGTNPLEMHIKVPRNPASEHLYAASRKALTTAVVVLLNKALTASISRLFSANPIVEVKWSMCENLVIKCKESIHDNAKAALTSVLTTLSDIPVTVLNRPPTTTLKFVVVPRRNEDGSSASKYDLINDLEGHPSWKDITFIDSPKFLRPDAQEDSGIVIITVEDKPDGSVGRALMNTAVYFSGGLRQCRRWVQRDEVRFCTTCQRWGHGAFLCRTNMIVCNKCSGNHSYKNHERHCTTCAKGPGHICSPKCINCSGPHFANSKDCPFYANRFNYMKIQALQKEQRDIRTTTRTTKPKPKTSADGLTTVQKGKARQMNDAPTTTAFDKMVIEDADSDAEPTPLPLPL